MAGPSNGPSEYHAFAVPRSSARHRSLKTPEPIPDGVTKDPSLAREGVCRGRDPGCARDLPKGAAPPTPAMKRNASIWPVLVANPQARLNTRKTRLETWITRTRPYSSLIGPVKSVPTCHSGAPIQSQPQPVATLHVPRRAYSASLRDGDLPCMQPRRSK